MTRLEAWSMHTANALVGGTGLIYAWMRYCAVPADEFAVVNHPLQPALQHAHVVFAPLLVFAAGLIWQRHVGSRLRSGLRENRTTGLALALTLVPMTASGYLLQTATVEAWRTAWIVVHVATSVLWLAGYVAHLLGAVAFDLKSRSAAAESLGIEARATESLERRS